VVGPASFNGSARIHDKTADYSGGIVAYGRNSDAATVNLYTTDPARRCRWRRIMRARRVAASSLKSSDSGAPAAACLKDFSLVQNTAQNGAAIYADQNNGSGSVIEFNLNSTCLAASGATACNAGVACNDVSDNIAQTSGGTATGGATIFVNSGGEFSSLRGAPQSRRQRRAIHRERRLSQYAQDYVDLHDCLPADNVESGTPGNLVEPSGRHSESQLEVRNCTIADNMLSASTVVDAGVDHAPITDSVFAQPGKLSLTGAPTDFANAYVLSNDTTTFGAGPGIEQGMPTLVDAAGQDYHLVRTSLGIDYAPSQCGVDFDGLPRTLDLTDIADNFGPKDRCVRESDAGVAGQLHDYAGHDFL
jgi:hypothetical protein